MRNVPGFREKYFRLGEIKMELRLRSLPILVMVILHSVVAREIRNADNVTVIDLCENTYKRFDIIGCYCENTLIGTKPFVFKAECGIDNEKIPENDEIWKAFTSINTIESLIVGPKRNKTLTYIPTQAFKVLRYLLKVTIQHGNVKTVHAFAFANHTSLKEIKLSRNGIKVLAINAFAHHPSLMSLTLDNNNIEEIKRNAFRRLPLLEHLYLTNNNISIIHDRAFSHLGGLKSLELDKNSIFVLTNETFTGLANLTNLHLSYNDIEVIGENTFHMLENLRTLFIDNNKIRLLDDGALRGLGKLESLLISNNKIKQLTSSMLFSGLSSLAVLEVRSNGMQEFAANAIEPILTNFYKVGSSIDVDDNNFPCDCNLNWFLNIRNNTKNTHLQEKIDNIMCYPSENLAEDFKKYEESQKSKSILDEKHTDNHYEYYDEESMDGKLFFSDIPRNMVPCDRPIMSFEQQLVPTQVPVITASKNPNNSTESVTTTTTNAITKQTTVAAGSIISTTIRKAETTAKPDSIKIPLPTITASSTETPVMLKPRITEVPRYTSVLYSHRTTQVPLYTHSKTKETVTDYTPPKSTIDENTHRMEYRPSHQSRHHSMKNVVPTEDMVSDGTGDSNLGKSSTKEDLVDGRDETKIIEEQNNIHAKEGVVQPTVYKSTIDQHTADNIVTVSGERKSPETMSHIHQASSANKILPMLAKSIPIWLFICLHFKL